jgi:Tol biopolymer transport system component
MPLQRGTLLGFYEIVGTLGAGGMGEVYRARDTKLGREVALKVLPEGFAADPERLGRFEREAKVLASLNHPNIAVIYGFEDSGGVRALVMELVEGQTVADRISSQVGAGPASSSGVQKPRSTSSPKNAHGMPLDEALPIAKQIAEGLEYAHERGIVHRDLKPANVKITPDGVAKILDFGLAKAIEGEAPAGDISSSPTLTHMATQAGIILGTAAYMSPEQAKAKPVDRRADIWAFGCVLYEMLTGRRAFEGETVSDILAAVIRAEPDWSPLPATTPAPIRKLLKRCLQKDAKQRLQAIGEARIAIEEALSGAVQDSGALAAPAVAAAPKSGLRRVLPWVLATACVVLGIALGAAYFGRSVHPASSLRFAIGPPENGELGTSLALSPDGRRLAFVATTSGKSMLWLRPLNSLTAQPISGTEDAEFPFWSPDGRSVGFFADDKLKRVDLGSGSVETLAPVTEPRGGSWGANGKIIYSPSVSSPLLKIAAAGGSASPATVFDSARQDESHRWPYFLPDGKHFLFLEERTNGARPAIEVGSLDSPKVQPLMNLPEDSSMVYADGYLLFSKSGELEAQPFDPNSLKVTANAAMIAPNVSPVGQTGPTGYVAISAAGSGLLVYRSSVSRISQLTLVDRSGKTLGTIGTPRGYSSPHLSPDGKKIVVAIPDRENPGQSSLWIVEVANGSLTRLTYDKHDNVFPIWSSDGRWIYFQSNASGPYNIYRKPADGSGPRQLVRRSPDLEGGTSFAENGRFLLFDDMSPKTGADIWYLPLQPGATAKVFLNTPADEEDAVFSPDGKWVAYESDENGPSDFEVFVAPFPPSGSKWQISTNGGYWPLWGRNGHELFFISGGELMAAKVIPGPTFHVQAPQALFPIQPPEDDVTATEDYSVFPGGQKFLLNKLANTGANLPITAVTNWTLALKGR